MQVFYYLPPNTQEQRSFFALFCGTLLSIFVAGVLAWRSDSVALRAVLAGAVMGVLYLLGREAWRLENKARRAQNAQFAIDETGVEITDAQGVSQRVEWDEIEATEVLGGKFSFRTKTNHWELSTREVEEGLKLIKLIAARGKSTPPHPTVSNFIALEPK